MIFLFQAGHERWLGNGFMNCGLETSWRITGWVFFCCVVETDFRIRFAVSRLLPFGAWSSNIMPPRDQSNTPHLSSIHAINQFNIFAAPITEPVTDHDPILRQARTALFCNTLFFRNQTIAPGTHGTKFHFMILHGESGQIIDLMNLIECGDYSLNDKNSIHNKMSNFIDFMPFRI